MAELLGEYGLNGKLRYTKPNTGWPRNPRKYTIKKFKYKSQLTVIWFYDTISMSPCFGFKIRRYKHKSVLFFLHPGYRTHCTPIHFEGYKEIITVLKENTKQFH